MNVILIEDEQEKYKVTDEIVTTVKNVCDYSLEYENCDFDAEISVTFTDNAGICELNRIHRGIDRATDVLSFPILDFDEEGNIIGDECEYNGDCLMMGDIVISLERAYEQSVEFGHSFIREIAFLTAHSMLHLLGYDHVDDEEGERIMRKKQSEILEGLGILRD